MARLLPLLLFLAAAALLSIFGQRESSRARDPRAYRPRARSRSRPADSERTAGAPFVMRRAEFSGLRDAYSGEPLDPSRAIVRCEGCGVLYHVESANVLARENAGRCAGCGRQHFRAVVVDAG
jgi:hypothetical protein